MIPLRWSTGNVVAEDEGRQTVENYLLADEEDSSIWKESRTFRLFSKSGLRVIRLELCLFIIRTAYGSRCSALGASNMVAW